MKESAELGIGIVVAALAVGGLYLFSRKPKAPFGPPYSDGETVYVQAQSVQTNVANGTDFVVNVYPNQAATSKGILVTAIKNGPGGVSTGMVTLSNGNVIAVTFPYDQIVGRPGDGVF